MARPPARFLPVRRDWLALGTEEEVLDPDLRIVDAHHHLWDRPGWRYLLDDFLADVHSGHRVVASVYVQCGAMYRRDGAEPMRTIGEVEFANGMAAMGASGLYGTARVCDGIVSYVDLRWPEPALREVLEAQISRGGGRLKGVRQITAWDRNPEAMNPETGTCEDMLRDARFRAGFALLAGYGLRFDAWVFHHQLPDLVDLARAYPGMPIVLDHCGTPLGIAGYEHARAEVFRSWSAHMADLASCANVFIKLGGLGMRAPGLGFTDAALPLTSQALAERMRPIVHTCIERFGASRCMFESNFPVDMASFGYRTCWNAFKRLVGRASKGEKESLFCRTAHDFYGLTDLSLG